MTHLKTKKRREIWIEILKLEFTWTIHYFSEVTLQYLLWLHLCDVCLFPSECSKHAMVHKKPFFQSCNKIKKMVDKD